MNPLDADTVRATAVDEKEYEKWSAQDMITLARMNIVDLADIFFQFFTVKEYH